MDSESIQRALESSGLRCTPQRYAVMAFLMEQNRHPTAVEIFEAVNRMDPRSSRATTYNNLRDLVQAGLVREVAIEGPRGAIRREGPAASPFHLRPLRQRRGRRVVRRAQTGRGVARECGSFASAKSFFGGCARSAVRFGIPEHFRCRNENANASLSQTPGSG